MSRPGTRLACVVVAATLAVCTGAAGAGAKPVPPPSPPAASWVLVDAKDGTRLAAHAPHETRPIASTTKLMTAYLTLRALSLKRLVTAPRYVPTYGESLMGLKPGDRVRVRDLLYGLLVPSGNDAAVALADAVAGAVPAFVSEMNRAARALDLDDTHYENPVGLDAAGNYSTASDLADLALRLRRDPTFRKIVDTQAKTVKSGSRNLHLETSNLLLRRYDWVNGVKTGHTLDAGYVLVASGTRDGVTLLSALLGAPTEAARDGGTLSLLRYGFSLYRRVNPVGDGERLTSAALSFRDERLPLVAARGVHFTARKGQDVETRVVSAPRELDSAARGERLGRARVTLDGETQALVPLLAARSVGGPTTSDRLDSALPGSPATAWAMVGVAVLLLVALPILLAVAVGRRRRGR